MRLAILLVSAVLLAGCERAPVPEKPPAEPATAPRLAVLSPAMVILLADLGQTGSIVGRHGFDLTLPDSVPSVGDQAGFDYETLARLAPTDVLLETSARDLPPRLLQLSRERSWRIRAIPMLRLDDIPVAAAALDRIARGVGDDAPLSDRARSLIDDLNASWAPRPGLAERLGRTLILVAVSPPAAAGPGSFHYQLVARLGGHPIPERGSPYIAMTREDLVRLDPDSIVLILPGAPGVAAGGQQEALARLTPEGQPALRAAREGRVMLINDRLAHTPSSAMAAAARVIASTAAAWPPLPPGSGPAARP
ncbi:MAG: ABC transporter substrate-binding protein [Phycisphaerales bacterium]|nr:ABC transporter substrate-binding protein [Phycisphaerales bacterium]